MLRQPHGIRISNTLRVQGNTYENIFVFIPAIYLAGYYLNVIAAMIGSIFIVGRFMYYLAYVTDPSKRAPARVIGYFATALVTVGVGWGNPEPDRAIQVSEKDPM